MAGVHPVTSSGGFNQEWLMLLGKNNANTMWFIVVDWLIMNGYIIILLEQVARNIVGDHG